MLNKSKQIKYKKVRKGKLKKLEFKINCLKFGTYGLKAAESGIINSYQIEAARQAISRKIKRKGKIWIRIFSDLPVTSKPTGVRMGNGKGPFLHWGVKIAQGSILFEICAVSLNTIYLALKVGSAKLPIKTKICN